MALNREAVIRAAEKYVSKGKLEHAIKEYRKVLAENPNDANTLNRVGDLYARIERFDEAVKLFSQIAEQYTKDGFFVKAIAIYKKIIKLDPSALAVYERLAELYYKQGLLNEARTQYQVLADYYQKHDNATSATTIYQKMSQMEPENPSFHLKLAELYAGQRLTDKAMREYRQLADILIVNGSVDEATQVYEKALEVDSSDLEFVREAVGGLNDNGHMGAAAKLLAKAVELNPDAREIAVQAGMGGQGGAESPADEPSVDMAAEMPQADDDDVFSIDMEDDTPAAVAGSLDSTGFGDGSAAYVPGDESPFGSSDDTFDAPETSFSGAETSMGEVSFDSTPADETGGMGSLGGDDDDEVFTFDLDDDAIPSSQVMPPEDLDDAPITLDEAPDIEIDLDLGEAPDAGSAGLGEVLEDGGTEELGDMAADGADDGVFDLGAIDLEAPGDEVEIDWSMDSIDDLDVGMSLGSADAQPVEVEELDLGDFDEVDFSEPALAADETATGEAQVADAAAPTLEPFAPEDFEFESGLDDTVVVGAADAAPEDAELAPPEIELSLETPDMSTGLEDVLPAEDISLDDTIAVEEAAVEEAAVEEVAVEEVAVEAFDEVGEETLGPVDTEVSVSLDDTAFVIETEDAAPEDVAFEDVAPEEVAAAEESGDALPAVQRGDDLLAEATVFSKYGLKDKALDRLQDLQALHPDHPGGLQLELRMSLDGGDPDQTIALANRLAAVARAEGGNEHWDAVQDDLKKAGFSLVDDHVVHAEPAEPKKSSGDRIAQLLEDLSLEDLGDPGRARVETKPSAPVDTDRFEVEAVDPSADEAPQEDVAAPTVAVSRDALSDAMLEVQESIEDAPSADEAPAPAEPEPVSSGKQLFSLADELDLDELEDELEEVVAPPPEDASTEQPSAVDPLDETGMSWLDDVSTESPQAAQQVETIFDEEDDFFDLAAELERELSEEELAADDGIVVQPQEQSLEEIIEGFKQGVAENLSPEDYDTHYNLGIAYREMGLIDEAIGEFQLACKDERYLVDCSSMLGQCFLEKGLPELAVRWYRKGLEAPDIADEVSISLLYEMGNAYVSMGDPEAAYKTFVEIYGLNSNYRDVANKLQDLQGSAPG